MGIMVKYIYLLVVISVMNIVIAAVKVKVVPQSDDESRVDEDDAPMEATTWSRNKKKSNSFLPFILKHKKRADDKVVKVEYEDTTTEKPYTKPLHPNDMFFPLIYKQSHVNSMFKFGDNWYTWSIDKQSDGSKVTNYYICYDEPKHCDEIGWEHADSPPKCAFQIDSLTTDDRACVNSFGVEAHNSGSCDGAEQMKVADMMKACGPRIRSLWRFMRVEGRPAGLAKPADVNSLLCEDEEECFVTAEYRIHHDRITFSLHEPTRGQTYKSALKRDIDEEKVNAVTEGRVHLNRRNKKVSQEDRSKKNPRTRSRNKSSEGKGIVKEHNESGLGIRRGTRNRLMYQKDEISDEASSE